MKKSILIFIVFAIGLGFIVVSFINKNYVPAQVIEISNQDHPTTNPSPSPSTTSPAPSPTSTPVIKTTLLLSVPFTSQAPTANWDVIHNEDCEEASSIMVNAYYNGPSSAKLDPELVEGQLTKLTDWEMKTFGYNLDIKIGEAVKIIDGPFKEFDGKISEVNEQKGKIKVLVNMFGRETPIELDFLQVKKV